MAVIGTIGPSKWGVARLLNKLNQRRHHTDKKTDTSAFYADQEGISL